LKTNWEYQQLILFQSPFYNPFSTNSTKIIREIINLKHKIGFHYDSSVYLQNYLKPQVIIKKEIDVMNNYFNISIKEITVHNPTINYMLEFNLSNFVNADSKKFKENKK
jgi:hypothetical protein